MLLFSFVLYFKPELVILAVFDSQILCIRLCRKKLCVSLNVISPIIILWNGNLWMSFYCYLSLLTIHVMHFRIISLLTDLHFFMHDVTGCLEKYSFTAIPEKNICLILMMLLSYADFQLLLVIWKYWKLISWKMVHWVGLIISIFVTNGCGCFTLIFIVGGKKMQANDHLP